MLDAIGNLFGAKVRFKDPLLKPLSPNELKVFRDKVGEEKKAIIAADLPHSGVPLCPPVLPPPAPRRSSASLVPVTTADVLPQHPTPPAEPPHAEVAPV